MTADGVPVVLHDTTLDAVSDVAARFPGRARADGKHHCTDFTLEELRTLSFTERTDPATGLQTYADRFPRGQSRFGIVTLEEELEFLAGLNKSTGRSVGVYPEIKSPAWHRAEGHDVARAVVAILHRHGFATKEDPCHIQCFEPDEVIRIRRDLGWQGRLVQLIGAKDQDALVTPEGLARIAKVADGVGPPIERVLDATGKPTDLVARAHAAGLVVHPYTLRRDRLPHWAGSFDDLQESLFAAGVDGAFSDFPDLTVAWLRRGDQPHGEPTPRRAPDRAPSLPGIGGVE
jgi:glycerophosphoryl diester phosphodiesterase